MDQVSLDANNLEHLVETGQQQICEIVLNFLLERNNEFFQNHLDTFATQYEHLSSKILKSIVKSLLVIYQEAIRNRMNSNQFKLFLDAFELPSNLNELLKTAWSKQSVKIYNKLIQQYMLSNELIAFNWNFGVTVSSDECNDISKTFVQLNFTIRKPSSSSSSSSSNTIHNEFLELNVQQFYELLAQMEQCKAQLDLLDSSMRNEDNV
jgi:hypothetical protein